MSSIEESDESVEFETVPATPESRAVISATNRLPDLPEREGTVRPADEAQSYVQPALRVAGTVANGIVGTVVTILIALSALVAIVWFVSDLTHINTHVSSSAVRDQVISAVANLLANLMLVLILLEVVSSLLTFVRTRAASMRPLLFIPLFVVARGVILLVNQLLTSPPAQGDYNALIQLLAEIGALAFVGLIFSIAVAVLRDPINRKRTG
jgi:uncharacterized membrane protein (DUF373 family)